MIVTDTYFDTERHTCPQPAAFYSRHVCIMPSTSIILHRRLGVLVKSVAVGKMSRKTLLFDLGCTKPSSHYVLTKPTIFSP